MANPLGAAKSYVKSAYPDIVKVVETVTGKNSAQAWNEVQNLISASWYRNQFQSAIFKDKIKPYYDSYNEIQGRISAWQSHSKVGLGRQQTILTGGRGVREEPELALTKLKRKLGA